MRSMLLALSLATASGAQHANSAPDTAEPYRILIEANRTRDAALAASAYTGDAALIFEHSGLPREEHRGHDAILRSYRRTFKSVPTGSPIDLVFRVDPRLTDGNRQGGVYRVVVGKGEKAIRAYGRFSVVLRKVDGAWRFAEDRGYEASAEEFDAHCGRAISSH